VLVGGDLWLVHSSVDPHPFGLSQARRVNRGVLFGRRRLGTAFVEQKEIGVRFLHNTQVRSQLDELFRTGTYEYRGIGFRVLVQKAGRRCQSFAEAADL
jgi:hypothetical protein